MPDNDLELSFILPTYNERENIVELIKKIDDFLHEIAISGEIIVIDDDSPDGTSAVVKESQNDHPCVRLLTRTDERGLGTAYARGFDLAEGKVIITMDVDGSHDVRDIPRLLEKLDEGYDVAVGSRYVRGGGSDKPLLNRVISRYGGHYTRIMLGLGIIDSTNGFHAFRRELWGTIRHHRYSERNVFTIEFLYYARKVKARMVEVPVFFRERVKGESKTPLFQESFKALLLPFQLRYSR